MTTQNEGTNLLQCLVATSMNESMTRVAQAFRRVHRTRAIKAYWIRHSQSCTRELICVEAQFLINVTDEPSNLRAVDRVRWFAFEGFYATLVRHCPKCGQELQDQPGGHPQNALRRTVRLVSGLCLQLVEYIRDALEADGFGKED